MPRPLTLRQRQKLAADNAKRPRAQVHLGEVVVVQEGQPEKPIRFRKSPEELEEAKEQFTQLFPQLGRRLMLTCRMLHIDNRTVYGWCQDDPDFATWYEQELGLEVEEAEEEVKRRSMEGNSRHSDLLLMFRTKKLNPAYRDYQPRESSDGHQVIELIVRPPQLAPETQAQLPAPSDD